MDHARTYTAPLMYVFLVLVLCSEWSTCLGGNAMGAGCPDSGVRIYLDGHGNVTVNGKAVRLKNLGAELAALQPRPSVVCYSRDNPQQEPPAQYEVVMKAIMAMRLPVGLFTDDTFKTPIPMN